MGETKTPTAPLGAVDAVKPLVAEAVLMYRSHRSAVAEAQRRRVLPERSPAVREAAAQLDGACAILAKLWRLLGTDEMTVDRARAVVAQVEATADAFGMNS